MNTSLPTLPTLPTLGDTVAARQIVARYHPRTPLYPSASLSRRYGCQVWVKYENHAPIRSFKARGALVSLSGLEGANRTRGVVSASTGNHGQGLAYAGGKLGIPVTIVAPTTTAQIKVAAMRDLGADLRLEGTDLAQATQVALTLAEHEGKVYIEDGEDPGLMAGAASLTWEILDEMTPDVLLIPVGGGNLIASVAIVARAVAPRCQVIGVQSDAAPSVYQSWQAGQLTYAPCATFAGGLATDHPGALAFEVIRGQVDDVVTVREEDLRRGIVRTLAATGNVAEGAGAAAVAALERYGSRWAGQRVVALLSGGNIDLADLRATLTQYGDEGRDA
ncbi:MAG: threonine/serine dehydratase [Anaerolineae bacterium]|nr:threonine/serine dehydratase [Anaerolineae bacterium]